MALSINEIPLNEHEVVSQAEWTEKRKELLALEKEVMKKRDQMLKQRRALPWVKIDKEYVFDGPNGKQSLSELFDGRSQLIVYHFMFGPNWKEGCQGCSFISDHFDSVNQHLPHNDVTLVAVSRAPLEKLLPFKKRMGWSFKWISSFNTDFNYDFNVSFTEEQIEAGDIYYNFQINEKGMDELHGTSVFYKNEAGEIFHTYSTYARGGDDLLGVHHFLDLTPKGRNETSTMSWMTFHDKYEEKAKEECKDCCCS